MDYHAVRALLLTASPSSLSRLAHPLCCVLKPIVSDHEGDASLRLSLLQLVDTLLESPEQVREGKGAQLRALADHAILLLDGKALSWDFPALRHGTGNQGGKAHGRCSNVYTPLLCLPSKTLPTTLH
eukprot:scaffold98206_cov17-Tisochrysis_lutea.AAC.1